MASGMYANGIKFLTNGAVDYDTDTIKAQLTQSSYTFDGANQEAHDFRDDVVGSLVTGSTDMEVTTKAITINTTDNKVYLDCTGTITFASVPGGETAGGIVIYKVVGSAATDNLICWCQFSSNVETNGSDIQVTMNANGVASFQYV